MNGYRDYGDRALDVVTFIDRAQGLGFTLRDVAAHLRSPEGNERKARVQASLEAKLIELDLHIEQVLARRATVVELIKAVRSARAD